MRSPLASASALALASSLCLALCSCSKPDSTERLAHASPALSSPAPEPQASLPSGTALPAPHAPASAEGPLAAAASGSAGPMSVDAGPADAGNAGDGGGGGDGGGTGDAGDAGTQSSNGCPPEMARVGKACVDRWEARLWGPDGAGTLSPHPHNERPEAGVSYQARSEPGVFPHGCISRVEAAAACKSAGKRLCRMGEWLRACQGKKWATFPYGGKFQPGRCNTSKDHLLSKFFGTNGRAWKYDEHFNSPRLLLEPGFLAKTGEHEGCAGEDGVFDMVGNLQEWVSDMVDEGVVERLEKEPYERRKQPWREGNGMFLGGFFSTTKELGPGCKYITIAHEPSYHDYSIGFRCCKDAG